MSAPVTAPVDLDVAAYALRLGDDALVLGQRLAQWAARSPQLEEDVALLNLALDQLGAARSLLTLAGERAGPGPDGRVRSEDDLAFLRDAREFTNALLVELDDRGDFGRTVVRALLVAAFQAPLYGALATSTDPGLAGIAGKAVKEAAYAVDHARSWVVRLGDGTDESHRRVQAALDELWPYTAELFERDELVARLVERGVAPDPAGLEPVWRATVQDALTEATLTVPATTRRPSGGRRGQHTADLATALDEMQHLHRSHPGASW